MAADLGAVAVLVVGLLGAQFLSAKAHRITVKSRAAYRASSWHSANLGTLGGCKYTELEEATVQEEGRRPSFVRGEELVALENFESDFPPGQTSKVPEGLVGTVMERFSSGPYVGGIVVRFGGGDAGFAPRSFGKFGLPGQLPSVTIGFCGGRHVSLRKAASEYSAFATVEWEDPSLAGNEITPEDVGYIVKYTGSWAYSDNVAHSVLNGRLPEFPDPRTGRDSWVSNAIAPLTQEVLRFDVGFATAVNKIPPPEEPVLLYRGAWETPDTLEHLRREKGVAQTRFMSTTLAKDHACNFLSARNEPVECRHGGASGCISKQAYFPVRYEIQTLRAKSLQRWNKKESEYMVLPNVPFDVVSIEKVPNDRFWSMSTDELVRWLTPLFPELADAVGQQGVTGSDFVVGNDAEAYIYVDKLLGLYDSSRQLGQTGWPYEKHVALNKAMKAERFKLQCTSVISPTAPMIANQVPYYFRVVMQDRAA